MGELRCDGVLYEVGVDIGGTKVFVVIADDDGNIVFKEKIKTSPDVQKIIASIDSFLQDMKIPFPKLKGIGIGVPGVVNSESGMVLDSPSLKWHDLNLKEVFSNHYHAPVIVKNDVNLAVLGERYFGGNESDNIFYVAIGTGVGSAIIANGRIVEGAGFSAGEIGYFVGRNDVRQGRINSALEFGTFEHKTSGSALTEKGLKFGYSPQELFIQYRKHNPEVETIIDEFVLELSIMIANVVSLLNPEIVIIGGGVAESMECVIDKIRVHVSNFTPIHTKIELSKLGGEAQGLGGIACFLPNKNMKLEAKK